MESTGNNILSLNGNAENGMNMLHNISGFVNMNIENNVTFFENIKVTGTETVTVDKNGILSLRLKKQDTTTYNTIPTAVHAFSDRDGKHDMVIKGTSQEDAGTLNFITNGIGREIYVDMENIKLENMKIKTNSIIDSAEIHDDYIHLGAGSDLSGIVNPRVSKYDSLNKIYKSVYSSREENIEALRNILAMTFIGKHYGYNNATDEEQLKTLMSYLNSIYTETPYSYSSELSRRSIGMFRDIVAENHFRAELNKWMIMGGLTHADGGTKDSYYGQNYHGFDMGTAETDVDMKLTGAYALGKYGYSENVSLGVAVGGNRSEAEMSMSKVKGNSGYIGAFAENYRGNLTLKAGAGIQYSEYDADRATLGGHSYDEKYSDMAYDIYLNGRYSHNIGDNLFLEPYGTLSYTYIKQDSADEGSKALAIETDSKSFDYTSAKVGVDLKKVIPHEKGKSTLSAGVSYTRLLNGADEEYITGRFKGENASDFDILVAHKNEHSLGLNAKYTLELENGVLLDVKGAYAVERDSHNGAGKNKTKGEWIVGAGLGYKF
ncbi:autotransporter outer membrane beta-barrel domain-containing protein [Fusobacterium sp. THCT1E1]